MRRLLFSLSLLAAAATTQAADYERSNWRQQLYFQAEPAFLNFKGSVSDSRIVMDDINKDYEGYRQKMSRTS